ncbi:hypothetical protein A6E12_09315 [Aliivibrio fischeri]|uniref:glucosamine inositolphosphorylceramide transferase family protein n=1 Tax=Aliivibrio fischeri TaxID=668 RepID=UPI00080EBCBD|nr:hypothetical protein [Aliivibrio fischeri]OCH28679.1 hypothetical protein A6E12_09315 [Aliivibrio fischeri]
MKKLRISFLVDSKRIQKWQKDLIEDVSNRSNFTIDSILIPGDIDNTNEKKDSGSNNFLFKVYRTLDQKIFGSDYLNIVDISNYEEYYEFISLDYKKVGYRDYFSEKSINDIKRRNIDVVIRLGFRILSGEILACSNYGIWSFHHADNRINRGGPAGFWEIFNKESITGATLQILNESLDGGIVIDKCFTRTRFHSLAKNKESIIEASNILILSKLEELSADRNISNIISNKTNQKLIDIYDRSIYLSPTFLQLIKYILRIFKEIALMIFNKICSRDEWFIAFKKYNKKSLNFSSLTVLKNKKGYFKADPFLFKYDNKNWIFYEICKINRGKGWVEAYCIDDGTTHHVLEESWHLSYPNIWSHNGNVYMMPQSDNGEVNVYICEEFPSKWKLINKLISSDKDRFGDPTIYNNNIILTMYDNNLKANDRLYILKDVDLYKGKYTVDDLKLLISDVRNSRSAGNILRIENNDYRISQNCENGYGISINVNLINDDIKGELVETINPKFISNAYGVHTLNVNDEYLCVDFKKKRYNLYLGAR